MGYDRGGAIIDDETYTTPAYDSPAMFITFTDAWEISIYTFFQYRNVDNIIIGVKESPINILFF